MTNNGKSFLSILVSLRMIAWVPKHPHVKTARQKATSMGPIPWEKAKLEKTPINPQHVAAVIINKYPVNISTVISGKTLFEKKNEVLQGKLWYHPFIDFIDPISQLIHLSQIPYQEDTYA